MGMGMGIQALSPGVYFLGMSRLYSTCIPPVSHRILRISLSAAAVSVSLYLSTTHLAIFAADPRYPAVSHCILYPYVSSCIQLPAVSHCIPLYLTASKTGV